jgi:hypothetical protein
MFILIIEVAASILASASNFNVPGLYIRPLWSSWDWIPLWAFVYHYLFVLYLLWIEKHVRKAVVKIFLGLSCGIIIVPYVLDMKGIWKDPLTLVWIHVSLITLYILIPFLRVFWKIAPVWRFPVFW